MADFGEHQEYIAGLLIENAILSQDLYQQAKTLSIKKKAGIVDTICEEQFLTEEEILKTLAEHLGMEFVSLSKVRIGAEALDKIEYRQAKENNIIPVKTESGILTIATHRPLDLGFLDNLRLLINIPIETVVATSHDINLHIETYYQGTQVSPSHQEISQEEKDNDSLFNLLQEKESGNLDKDDAPIIRLVSSMISEAFRLKASDIHLEPLGKTFRVRYRIDGVLLEMKKYQKQLQAPITSRIKLLADMRIAEKRLPQDGKIKIMIKNTPIDIRVSTLPGIYGESVVMRLLDKSGLSLGLPTLGFLSDTEKIWTGLIHLSNGVILITGPTGSGKTTTLYSCLSALNKPERKIITVEDPIEYQLTGINQVQIREDINLTFSSVLRACLRQAPNIIMVGEIRDSETARIAMNAAFTGHLVFSTLHTNDAPGAITRLIDQGIEPFLVASAIRGVLAQRLVRSICQECKVSYLASDYEKMVLNLQKEKKPISIWKGEGCPRCNGTGYKGRKGIFELLVMNPEIQGMVYDKNSSSDIRDAAIRHGMRTLREDAILKVLNGTTTVQELLRVTKIGET